MVTRREFLGAGGGLLVAHARPGVLAAIDPIRRPEKPVMKLSVAAYGFRKYLDLKKPTLTLFDFIDFCAALPVDAVELTSYYFPETSDGYLARLKAHADAKKLAISGVPVRSDFCVRDEARRRADIEHVKKWVTIAKKLGAETVRIFAGSIPKGDSYEDAQKRVVAALEELCPHAEKEGILLGLENHGGITDTPEHLLGLVKPVKSPALGVNVDTGNFRTPDVYADVAKIAPYGVCVQVKTEILRPDGSKEPADLARMIQILKDAKYHGYVVLEYEAAAEPKVEIPKVIKQLRELMG